MFNGDISEISIIYDIKRDEEYINIFGLKFVENNKNKYKIIIDNKEYEITNKYNANNINNNNKLNLRIK